MSPSWTPQHPVDQQLAHTLIADQFPQMETAELAFVGRGWDNDVWRCGEIVFRFPHRPEGIPLVEREWAVLPRLADRMPVAIPVPIHRGEPASGYPAVFLGYRWLPGRLPIEIGLTERDRAGAAALLGTFLRAVHGVSLEEVESWDLPKVDNRMEVAERVVYARRRADELADTPHAALANAVADAMNPAPPSIALEDRCLVHGDMHAGQLLFDADRQLSGVIDWGEVCVGDPAYDLQVAFSFLPVGARDQFWAAYGPADPATVARARFIARSYGLAILVNALDSGNVPLQEEALFNLNSAR